MSSRVQKGNTVFRPVAKVRPRAPTVPPSQSSSGPSDLRTIHGVTPTRQSTLSQADSFTIPTTSREPLKPAHPQPTPIVPPQPHNVANNSLFSVHGMSFSGSSIPSHSPPVLINTSNLPPTLINVGRSMTESINAIDMPRQQDDRTPMIFSHPLNLPPELAMITADPARQSPAIFTPSGPLPIEFTSASIPPPILDSSQQLTRSEDVSQQQVQEVGVERPKRRRKSSRVSSEGEEEDATSNRKPKSRSTTPRQRRSRGPSLPPFDPSADPGEDIDPTVVTMATLCNDTGQGRVSSKAAEILTNHAAWKARNKERRARMRVAMEAKKYGRQADEESEQQPSSSLGDANTSNNSNQNAGSSTSGSGADEQTGIDYSQQMETSRYNVQVRIGPNGETIIDEESLMVDRAENEDTSNYTHVVESDHTKFVNSGTYGKRYRGSRWGADETELFYNALSQYGENYELIAYVLPGRDRKSCKNKFKAEDKKNHARINYCLNNRIPVDMKTLERMTGKDFSGPVPEIRAPPPPVIQLREQGAAEEGTSRAAPTKQVKKRSQSRTTGISEEGVIIIGDVDSVLS